MAEAKVTPNKPASTSESLIKLKNSFNRHAGIVFVIVVLGAVVYSVSTVNLVINTPIDDEYRTQKQKELTSDDFNIKTIQKIEALGDRNNPPAPALPAGRINPFLE